MDKKQFDDTFPYQRSDLQRIYELYTCPCTHCLEICLSIEAVQSCPKYGEWFEETMARREYEQNRQRKNNRKTP